MSIAELGSLGEFIGSIAVLVTLVYLVLQIRQNTLSIRSQSRYYVLEAVGAHMKDAQDPEFAQTLEKIRAGDASEHDLVSWGFAVGSWLSHLEMLFLEITDGTLPKAFEDTLRWRLAALLDMGTSSTDAWQRVRGNFTGSFQQYVDAMLQGDLQEIIDNPKHY